MGLEDILKKPERPKFVYDVPASMSDEIKSVTLVELTAEEQLAAAKRAGDNTDRRSHELIKGAIIAINDQKVSLADGTLDKAWNYMPSKLRSLLAGAFGEIHNPSEDERRDFLKSRQVRSA